MPSSPGVGALLQRTPLHRWNRQVASGVEEGRVQGEAESWSPTGRGPYLGGDGKGALAADPGCALSLSRGWGPWALAVLVIS